jgi:hypothetical protein
MTRVRVAILHRTAGPDDGPLTRTLIEARAAQAERHAETFRTAGASEVTVLAGPPDGRTFGARLRTLVADLGPDDGLVVLGSGAVPRLTLRLARWFVAAAASSTSGAAANDRYSADIVSVARARAVLETVPDLATDNALPRWLTESAGIAVLAPGPADRARLAMDLDSPLDLLLLGGAAARALPPAVVNLVRERLDAIAAVTRDPSRELLVAGRTSAATLRLLELRTATRTRALIEERGLRTARAGQRAPASVLGMLLDRDGPEALGTILARLGDAAVIDTRVLLANRCGADERGWPPPEDRFASDLLLPDRIADPWLRAATTSAVAASIPILLGAHTLVGPGLPMALGITRR